MPNPFAYGAHVTDPSRFVGREAELRRIFAALDTAHTGQLQSVSVVGPRRIGKSSLLYHLTQIFRGRIAQPERYVFAYVDLNAGKYGDLQNLLKGILADLHDALPNGSGTLKKHLREAARGQQVGLPEFENAVSRFRALSLYPVICLDEFEQLTEHPAAFSDLLFDSWRSLINGSNLSFVIASRKPLHELVKDTKLTSTFFGIFSDFIELGELTEPEARALINWGRQSDRPFTDDDCRHALKLAGRHPLKLQLAGSLIYEAKADARIDWPTLESEYRRRERLIFFGHKTVLQEHTGGIADFLVVRMPQALGHWVFLLLGRPTDNNRNNLIVGWTILIVVFPVVVAIIRLGLLPLVIGLIRALK